MTKMELATGIALVRHMNGAFILELMDRFTKPQLQALYNYVVLGKKEG